MLRDSLVVVRCLENPRPKGGIVTNGERLFPFQAEPTQLPLLSRAHAGHYNERRIALQDAREAVSEYDRAVIAETKARPS